MFIVPKTIKGCERVVVIVDSSLMTVVVDDGRMHKGVHCVFQQTHHCSPMLTSPIKHTQSTAISYGSGTSSVCSILTVVVMVIVINQTHIIHCNHM